MGIFHSHRAQNTLAETVGNLFGVPDSVKGGIGGNCIDRGTINTGIQNNRSGGGGIFISTTVLELKRIDYHMIGS